MSGFFQRSYSIDSRMDVHPNGLSTFSGLLTGPASAASASISLWRKNQLWNPYERDPQGMGP